jgi:hypothetical protein
LKFWSLSGEGSSNCPSLGEETEALLGSLLVKKAKEGFFMAVSIAGLRDFASRSFELIKDSMLQSDSLPLADVLDCQQWRAEKGVRTLFRVALVGVERRGRAVNASAAERQLTLRRAKRRARMGGEAAGRHAFLLGRTQKRVLTPFLRLSLLWLVRHFNPYAALLL